MKNFKTIIITVLFLVLSATITGCTQTTKSEDDFKRINNAYITLDINPSIEIITGADGLVEQVNALNDDAQVLLIDVNFTGKTVGETVETLLLLASDLGYLDLELENAILITTETETPEDTTKLEATITEKVAKFVEDRKMKIDLIKANFAATEDIKTLAADLDISVGKVKLITYAMAFDDTLTMETAAVMPVRDLNKIIIAGRKEVKEFYSEEVRNQYLDLKDEVKFVYKIKVIELINTEIQNAADDKFAEILANSETSVTDLKVLYQAYYDELVNFTVPTEEENNTEIQLVVDQIEALNLQLQTIKAEIKALYKSMRNPGLTNEELENLLAQIKEKVLSQRQLSKQLRDFSKTLKGKWNGYRNHGKNNSDKGLNINKFEKRININKYYQEIAKKYRESFSELNIDMSELESVFADQLQTAFDLLNEEKEQAIQTIMNELNTQSKIIKDQMVEEKKLLKDVWNNKKISR